MKIRHVKPSPILAVAAVALVVGLAAPAAASQASHLINGNTIKKNTVTGKQVKESTLGTVPKAAAVSLLKWHKLTLKNGATNYNGSARAPSYALSSEGIVYFRGAISGTEGDAFTVLPAALRPKAEIYLPMDQCDATTGRADITTDGSAYLESSDTNPCNFWSLDGISYSARG